MITLPVRTWVPRPSPAKNEGPYPTGGKHGRLAFDTRRGRLCYIGGDYDYQYAQDTSFAGGAIWALDVETNVWTKLVDSCVPDGQIAPHFPDNCGWCYDSRRDRLLLGGGYFSSASYASKCRTGSTPGDQPYAFDLGTGLWTGGAFLDPPGGWGGAEGGSFWDYDPVSDNLYRGLSSGRIQVFNVGSDVWTEYPVVGGNAALDQKALDPVGRWLWWIDRWTLAGRANPSRLVGFHLDTQAFITVPLPVEWVYPDGEFHGSDMETYLVWMPRHRRVAILSTGLVTTSGFVSSLIFFDPDRLTFEVEAVPNGGIVDGLTVRANLIGYDDAQDVLVLLGRTPGHYWLYRYALQGESTMPQNILATISSGPQGFPTGTPAVATYLLELMDILGVVVSAQSFPSPPATATFVSPAPGTYTARGSQRDAGGITLGTPVISNAITVQADVTLIVLQGITLQVIRA